MKSAPRQATPVITIPLEERDRAFLRMLHTTMGGRMQLVTLFDRKSAEACEIAGYCKIDRGGKRLIVTITPRGTSYLAKLRGAH